MPPGRVWLEAARPRTLAAGASPVLVGTAAAGRVIAWRAAAALVVAVALQVAVNFANDLFDARRGVDAGDRAGPRRAVASGLVTDRQMTAAIASALCVAGAAGMALAAAAGWELLAVGLASIAAALGYSGGRSPYADLGLGEAGVFVFFGVVATTGSAYVQIESVSARALVSSLPMGLLAAAILVANNVRDIDTDARAAKRTVAVRLGPVRTRALYRALIAGAFAALPLVALVANSPWPLLGLAAVPAARRPLTFISSLDRGELVAALVATAGLELLTGVALAAGLWASR